MSYNWKWENLPKHEHNKVIAHVEMGMIGHLMSIHNKYELSGEIFCCPYHEPQCKLWFTWAVDNQIIKFQDE